MCRGARGSSMLWKGDVNNGPREGEGGRTAWMKIPFSASYQTIRCLSECTDLRAGAPGGESILRSNISSVDYVESSGDSPRKVCESHDGAHESGSALLD